MDQSPSIKPIEYVVHNFDTVSSTLDVAGETHWQHGDIIVAQQQSAGRGQRGNQWHSAKGENLTFTLIIHPNHIAVNEQFVISMITSLAVVEALGKVGVEAQIKWPNDIYVGEKKICGILIEHFMSSEVLDKSILGVGINVSEREFDPSLLNPTSLALLGVKATNDQVLQHFCDAFSSFYVLPTTTLKQLYMNSLYRRHGLFPYRDSEGDFLASITSIDPHSGVITLTDQASCARSYYFKQLAFL